MKNTIIALAAATIALSSASAQTFFRVGTAGGNFVHTYNSISDAQNDVRAASLTGGANYDPSIHTGFFSDGTNFYRAGTSGGNFVHTYNSISDLHNDVRAATLTGGANYDPSIHTGFFSDGTNFYRSGTSGNTSFIHTYSSVSDLHNDIRSASLLGGANYDPSIHTGFFSDGTNFYRAGTAGDQGFIHTYNSLSDLHNDIRSASLTGGANFIPSIHTGFIGIPAPTAVPEPSSILLLGLGALGFFSRRKR